MLERKRQYDDTRQYDDSIFEARDEDADDYRFADRPAPCAQRAGMGSKIDEASRK